jgi:hypothetical protein
VDPQPRGLAKDATGPADRALALAAAPRA